MTESQPCRPCVVTIEPSDGVRSLYRELLRDEGYDVTTLHSHEATGDALRKLRPGVVLLGCNIGGDPLGWDLLQALSLDVDLQMVPVVICTTDALVFGDEARGCIDDSIMFLPKPFDAGELLGAIASAVAGTKLPAAD